MSHMSWRDTPSILISATSNLLWALWMAHGMYSRGEPDVGILVIDAAAAKATEIHVAHSVLQNLNYQEVQKHRNFSNISQEVWFIGLIPPDLLISRLPFNLLEKHLPAVLIGATDALPFRKFAESRGVAWGEALCSREKIEDLARLLVLLDDPQTAAIDLAHFCACGRTQLFCKKRVCLLACQISAGLKEEVGDAMGAVIAEMELLKLDTSPHSFPTILLSRSPMR